MAEEVRATPGWVEERLEEIWSTLYLPGTEPVVACRNAYLVCLSTCGIGSDADRCHDTCRAELITCLRQARMGAEALTALETELEGLEAEITDTT